MDDMSDRQPREAYCNQLTKINSELRKLRQKLEEKKAYLSRQLASDRPEPPNGKYLTHQDIHGYKLRNFSTNFLNEDEKIFSASCDEVPNKFKMSVTMKGEDITAVDVALSPDSALLEIEDILWSISEECCPQQTLLSIQQFSHLNSFRMEVLKKIQSSFRFSVKLPQNRQGGMPQGVLIHTKNSGMGNVEIEWKIRRDNTRLCLVHSLLTSSMKEIPLLRDLKPHYLHRNQKVLMDWWINFFNNVCQI